MDILALKGKPGDFNINDFLPYPLNDMEGLNKNGENAALPALPYLDIAYDENGFPIKMRMNRRKGRIAS